VDRALGRLFTARFKLGMFDSFVRRALLQHSLPRTTTLEAHRQMALRMASDPLSC